MSELQRLAAAYGVATEYFTQSGEHRDVPEETVRAVLASLGVDASDDDQIEAALRDRELTDWRRTLPPVFIHRQPATGSIWVHVEDGDPVQVSLTLEGTGDTFVLHQIEDWTPPQEVEVEDDLRLIGQASFQIPPNLPLGWHTVRAEGPSADALCPLVVTPDQLPSPPKGWGMMAQLYSVRSRDSWGLGDLHDLGELANMSADAGANFVLVNPLHAAEVAPPMTPSPYLPSTRRFFNGMYLRVEDINEYVDLAGQSVSQIEELAAEVRSANTSAGELDRDATWAAKLAALEIVASVPLSEDRQAAFTAYREAEGQGLVDFATWCAFSEAHGPDWRQWPEGLRDPLNAAVVDERNRLAERVAFFEWLQWQVDQQLASAEQSAERAGMSIGVVHDLAVGVHLDGADSWRLAKVLAPGVTVGAPPDSYNQMGQNWDQPPWRPDELAAQAFIPYRDMIRTILRHAGGIRVDHILGLFRQWWIPEGFSPTDGTYVQMDHEALIGILALEARRAGAVLIGEDLGTLSEWIVESLSWRGICGVGVMWFQVDGNGPIPPKYWRWDELASVTVHDLPPTSAYLKGEHIRIRGELGLLTGSMSDAYAAHVGEVMVWLNHARDLGLFSEGDCVAFDSDLHAMASGGDVDWDSPTRTERVNRAVVALYGLLPESPAVLLGVNLPDLVGDQRAQNQPGTDREYPNWNMPLTDDSGEAVLLEDVGSGELAQGILDRFRDVK